MLFVVVNYTILLVGWFVPWLHRARVGSNDVVRLSGQDTTLAKDKFSSHLSTNSAAPHSNNFTGGFFCRYNLEEITLSSAKQYIILIHQLLLGSFLLFRMGRSTPVVAIKCFQQKEIKSVLPSLLFPFVFFPVVPYFLVFFACSLFSSYFAGLKKNTMKLP